MTITIHLAPAIEQQLRVQAESTGKNISTLVIEAVEARLALAPLQLKDILAPVHADFCRSGMSEADLSELLETSLEKARSGRRTDPDSTA